MKHDSAVINVSMVSPLNAVNITMLYDKVLNQSVLQI